MELCSRRLEACKKDCTIHEVKAKVLISCDYCKAYLRLYFNFVASTCTCKIIHEKKINPYVHVYFKQEWGWG